MILWHMIFALLPLALAVLAWIWYSWRVTGVLKLTLGLCLLFATWWSGYQFMELESAYLWESRRRDIADLLYRLVVDKDPETIKRSRQALEKNPELAGGELLRLIER